MISRSGPARVGYHLMQQPGCSLVRQPIDIMGETPDVHAATLGDDHERRARLRRALVICGAQGIDAPATYSGSVVQ